MSGTARPSGARKADTTEPDAPQADPGPEATEQSDVTGYQVQDGEVVTHEDTAAGTAVIVNAPAEPEVPAAKGSNCVVDEGPDTVHVGQAIKPGVVCSYHTMHYHSDGSPRTGLTANRPSRTKAKSE